MKKRPKGVHQGFDHRSMKRNNLPQKSTGSHQTQSEKIVHIYGVDMCFEPRNMAESIEAVESLLMYTFNDKRLLEEALTHSSYTDAPSYQRLEFLGDSALGLAISSFFFLTYPDVDAGRLSDLRSANVSAEKFARVAVRHGLYKYIRHNKATVLSDKVWEFLIAVEEEEEMVVHGGRMKPPKVLVDIVESVAAAVYVDCGFNLQMLWMIFRRLLEPLVMLDVVLAQPQPISALYEACHKDGKQVDIRYLWNGYRNVASVFVDDTFVASGSSETKENAKLHAAEAALSKITKSKGNDTSSQKLKADNTFIASDPSKTKKNAKSKGDDDTSPQTNVGFNESNLQCAKQKVHDLCIKKRWPKPTYRVEQELGPAHDKRYVSSVEVELSDKSFIVKGNERSRVKDAENSAASMMFHVLREAGEV